MEFAAFIHATDALSGRINPCWTTGKFSLSIIASRAILDQESLCQ